MRYFFRVRRVWVLAGMLAPALTCGWGGVARAQGDNWGAWNAFKAQVKLDERMQTDAAGLTGDLDAFLAKNPDLGPTVEPIALNAKADVLRRLKQDDAATALYDEGIARYKGQAGAITLVWGKADLLLTQNKPSDVVAFVEAQWPVVTAAGRSGRGYVDFASRQAVQLYITALEASSKGGDAKAEETKAGREKVIAALQKVVLSMPIFLDGGRQNFGMDAWQTGWMYEKLVNDLIADGRAPEALAWSALYYRVSAFKGYSVAHATAQLNRAWAANENFSAPRLFTRAQTQPIATAPVADAAPAPDAPPVAAVAPAANPLFKIALPTQDDKLAAPLKERLEQLAKARAAGVDGETDHLWSEEMVSIRLALGTRADAGEAMTVARAFLRAQPDSPDGALMVCRVLKSVDGNALRANAFVAYLNGQGENPLAAFDKEVALTP